jgi:hypothetical protein
MALFGRLVTLEALTPVGLTLQRQIWFDGVRCQVYKATTICFIDTTKRELCVHDRDEDHLRDNTAKRVNVETFECRALLPS